MRDFLVATAEGPCQLSGAYDGWLIARLPDLRRSPVQESPSPGWVVEEAVKVAKGQPGPPGQWWEELWARHREVTLAGLLTTLLGLSALALGLVRWHLRLFSSLAPPDSQAAQLILWQIETGLIVVVLPAYLVVVQFSSTVQGELANLPVVETLRSDTGLPLALVGSGVCFVEIGVDALWLHSPETVVFDALLLAFTAVLVLRPYVKLAELAESPVTLKELAVKRLRRRLVDTIDYVWAVSRANDVLAQTLAADPSIGVDPAAFLLPAPDWQNVTSGEGGIVGDVQAAELLAALRRIPAQVGSADQPVSLSTDATTKPIYFLLACGDTLVAGETPVIRFDTLRIDLPRPDQLWPALAPALKIDPIDG